MNEVESFLREHSIEYRLYRHPPVYTVAEAEKYTSDIPGLGCKNLFLKSKRGDNYFLLVLAGNKRADLGKFAKRVGIKKVSFASPKELKEILGVKPGSVSPFNLINDKRNVVKISISQAAYEAPFIHAHPNINTASLLLSKKMFHRFLKLLGRKINIYEDE